jgi:hypothetical protein
MDTKCRCQAVTPDILDMSGHCPPHVRTDRTNVYRFVRLSGLNRILQRHKRSQAVLFCLSFDDEGRMLGRVCYWRLVLVRSKPPAMPPLLSYPSLALFDPSHSL